MTLLQVILFFLVGITIISCGDDPTSPPNIDPHNVSKINFIYYPLSSGMYTTPQSEKIEMKRELYQAFCEELANSTAVDTLKRENCFWIEIIFNDNTVVSLVGRGKFFLNEYGEYLYFEAHNNLVEKYFNIREEDFCE